MVGIRLSTRKYFLSVVNGIDVQSCLVCLQMPIEWMMEEESPVGTMLGTVKDRLAILNNASQWLDRIRFKVDSRSQTQAFLLDPNTGW
jgi:hypothetical protein